MQRLTIHMVYALFFLIGAIASLFILFILSENDFILIRRNITLTAVFNHAFIAFAAGFISGRIFYILDTAQFSLLNPLLFFHIVRYPGFSLFGNFIGEMIVILAVTKDKKALGRIADIFSLSFYPLIFLYLFFDPFSVLLLPLRLLVFVALIVLFVAFFNSHKNYLLKDSSIFFVVLVTFSHFNLLHAVYTVNQIVFFRLSFSETVSIFLIVTSVFMLIKNERKFLLKKK